jgi:hypothetical protein
MYPPGDFNYRSMFWNKYFFEFVYTIKSIKLLIKLAQIAPEATLGLK